MADKAWRMRNPESVKRSRAKWYAKNKEKVLAINKAWRLANASSVSAQKKSVYQERRRIVISHYSNGKNWCSCCHESIFEFLAMDHIGGGGQKHLRRIKKHLYAWLIDNEFPDGFRVLCFNCNFAGGIHGYCPHERLSKTIQNNSHVLV